MPHQPRGLRKKAKPEKTEYARKMRASPSKPEERLWLGLRARRLGGHRFRRQAVILGWIADFYCPAARLVVEVDGPLHRLTIDYDQHRDAVMKVRGLTVLRIPSRMVTHDLALALRLIADALVASGRPPSRGRGLTSA